MAKRADANQSEIVATLRRLGASVVHLHAVGKGCPDLAIAIRGQTHLVEIKDGRKSWKMTPDQIGFHLSWNAPIKVLDSVETTVSWVQQLTEP